MGVKLADVGWGLGHEGDGWLLRRGPVMAVARQVGHPRRSHSCPQGVSGERRGCRQAITEIPSRHSAHGRTKSAGNPRVPRTSENVHRKLNLSLVVSLSFLVRFSLTSQAQEP